jgi:hypothetical protein
MRQLRELTRSTAILMAWGSARKTIGSREAAEPSADPGHEPQTDQQCRGAAKAQDMPAGPHHLRSHAPSGGRLKPFRPVAVTSQNWMICTLIRSATQAESCAPSQR